MFRHISIFLTQTKRNPKSFSPIFERRKLGSMICLPSLRANRIRYWIHAEKKNRCTLNICAPFFPVSTPDTLPKWLRGWTRCKRIFFQPEYGSRFLFFGPNWSGFFCLNEKRSHEKRSEFWVILELVLIGRFLLGLIFCIFYFETKHWIPNKLKKRFLHHRIRSN